MCNKFLKVGLLYFYGELSSKKEKAVFEKHLKECKTCYNHLEELKQVSGLYTSLPLEKPSPSLNEKILEESRKKIRSRYVHAFVVLSHLLRNAKIKWSIGAAMGGLLVVITIGISHFLSQPKTSLEWSDGVDTKISTLKDKVQTLAYASDFEDIFSANLDTKIENLSDRIKTLGDK